MDISKLLQVNGRNSFFGIYEHKHSIYRISLTIPKYPLMKCSEIKILKDLHHFTFEYEDTDDINEFFEKFISAVNFCDQDGVKTAEATLQRKRNDILNELSFLSSQETYDISVASDLTVVKISDKSHYLNLTINNHLNVAVSAHSLPVKYKWFQSSTGSITSYFNEFTRFLEQLEEFFRNINTIDELCFVVDPMQPSTKVNFRIFKIDQKCFAKVEMDPILPSSISVTFIGPTMEVESYRKKYEQEVSNWDHELDVHKNLLKICGLVYFPMRNEQDDDDDLCCSICGMFRMDDSIPIVCCDNIKCDLLFHVGCLKQWWSMFADNKTFLHIELDTKCPMCKEKLSTSFELLFTDREN